MRCCAAFLLALLPTLPAAALDPAKPFRDYVTDNWGVEQGLPQISVLAITQDEAGYYWFGTQAGLARFDGVHFQRYTQYDAAELSSNIQALLSDGPQRLWVGTARELLLFENGRFQAIPATTPGTPERIFPVSALLKQADGRVLVAGPDGIYTVDGKRLQRLHALPGPARP